jgi:hypothetical protein
MEPRGCNQWAISGKSKEGRNGESRRKRLPWVATSCRRSSMVRVHPHQEREGVTFLAPQEAKSCEPEGPQDLTQPLLPV